MSAAIEVTGESIEAAIANGLSELGLGPGDVIVEVLEEPSRGVLGLGAREARVRLQPLVAAPEPETESDAMPTLDAEAPTQQRETYYDDDQEDEPLDSLVGEAVADEVAEADATVGKEVLGELLEKMSIQDAAITIRRAAAADAEDGSPWLLDVSGRDLSRLIGRRGETLSALQYVTRLIASRELQRRANIVVDVDGYKSRRTGKLRQLARRMADQAINRGNVVSLEPMPPFERRIIHIALRDHPDVETRSVGEGNGRKVTIVPK